MFYWLWRPWAALVPSVLSAPFWESTLPTVTGFRSVYVYWILKTMSSNCLSVFLTLVSPLPLFSLSLQHYAETPGSPPIMLELGSCSVSSQSFSGDYFAAVGPGAPAEAECPAVSAAMGKMCGSRTPRRHILPSVPADCESWQKHRTVEGSSPFSDSCSFMEPPSLSTSFDTLYLPATAAHPNRLGLSLDVASTCDVGGGLLGLDGDLAISPNVIKRRRGGLIEQKDIVKAHQAHKIHSTPQARRKEWEWVFIWPAKVNLSRIKCI